MTLGFCNTIRSSFSCLVVFGLCSSTIREKGHIIIYQRWLLLSHLAFTCLSMDPTCHISFFGVSIHLLVTNQLDYLCRYCSLCIFQMTKSSQLPGQFIPQVCFTKSEIFSNQAGCHIIPGNLCAPNNIYIVVFAYWDMSEPVPKSYLMTCFSDHS